MNKMDLELIGHLIEQETNLNSDLYGEKVVGSTTKDHTRVHGIFKIICRMDQSDLILEINLLRTADWTKILLPDIHASLSLLGPVEFIEDSKTKAVHFDLWVRKRIWADSEREFILKTIRTLKMTQKVALKLQQQIPINEGNSLEQIYSKVRSIEIIRPFHDFAVEYFSPLQIMEWAKEYIDYLLSGNSVIISAGGILTHRLILKAIATICHKRNLTVGLLSALSDPTELASIPMPNILVIPEAMSKDGKVIKVFTDISQEIERPFIILRSPVYDQSPEDYQAKYFSKPKSIVQSALVFAAIEWHGDKAGGLSINTRKRLQDQIVADLDRFGPVEENTIASLVKFNLSNDGMIQTSNLEMLFKLSNQ